MDGLGRVEKERWRSGGGQRGADLLADDARLAQAHRDDAAAAGVHQLHNVDEGPVEMIDETKNGGCFDLQHTLRLGNGGRIGGVSERSLGHGRRWYQHTIRIKVLLIATSLGSIRINGHASPRAFRSCGSSAA